MNPRPQTWLLPILSIFFWINAATAQEPERIKTITISADSAYTKVVQALQESGYYIAQLDRPSGFIQTSISLKSKSIFGRDGDKRIFNFLVVPLTDPKSFSIYFCSNGFKPEAVIPEIITTMTKASSRMIKSIWRSGAKSCRLSNKNRYKTQRKPVNLLLTGFLLFQLYK